MRELKVHFSVAITANILRYSAPNSPIIVYEPVGSTRCIFMRDLHGKVVRENETENLSEDAWRLSFKDKKKTATPPEEESAGQLLWQS